MKIIKLIRNKLKKYTKKEKNILLDNKITNIGYISLKNELLIKELFKLNIYKTYIYNLNIIKRIKPISIFYIIYKNCFKNV